MYHVKEILAAAGLEVEAGKGEDDAAQVGDRELLGVVQGVLGDRGGKKKEVERAGTGKRLKTPAKDTPGPTAGLENAGTGSLRTFLGLFIYFF